MKLFFTLITLVFIVFAIPVEGQVKVGASNLEAVLGLLSSKHVGIVANPASVVGNRGVNIVDTLIRRGVQIKSIFCPEHGFRSFAEAGQLIPNRVDSITKLPVISLYGKKKRPSQEDLTGLDIVVFDLQDVGVRFFTYISTLTYVMEACAGSGIPLVVLDRPNPNGFYIDGPVLEKEFTSFVGLHPVPVVYGMTIGEYAKMVNGEKWMSGGTSCNLTVIPLENYNHSTLYELPVKPSPNLTTQNAVYLYPSLCFFEGTRVSVGRGTLFPFEIFGHPEMKGFSFEFIPESIPGMSSRPPFEGVLCRGLDLRHFYEARPKMFGRLNLSWLLMAHKDMGGGPDFFTDYFDKLVGTSTLRKQMLDGKTENQIRLSWQPAIEAFKKIRAKYLIYPE